MRKDNTQASAFPAPTKLSVKLVGFFILLVSPFVLLWLVDRSFSFMHWRFYPDSFPSEREVMMRNNLMPRGFLGDQKAFMEEIKSPKVKVAIFGGSSAVGFAAPVGFDRFLEEAAPDRLVVHNYAEAGSPFAGYQAELAKVVMPYYDVILLYAGHNENWSYLYRRSKERNEKIVLPWGSKVEYQAADFRHSLKKMELERLFNDDVFGAGGGDSSYINRIRTTFWGDIYNISNNSRLVYFIKSIGSKIIGNTSLASASPEHAVRLPFFQKEAFMDNDVKQTFVDNYATAVSEIQNKLRPGQRLVISTILANDLFPPLLDTVDKGASVAEADSKAASLYEAVAKGNFNLSPDDVAKLPGSAHKAYLNAVICLGGLYPINSENHLDKKCLDMGLEARRADTMPTRAVPGINEFVRTLANKYENVTVIDPDARVTAQRGQSDYLDFFVDFLHPSSLGQMTIANEMLHALLPQEKITLSPNGACDVFVVRNSQGERPIAAKTETLKSQVETNLKWLNWFLDRMSTSYMYEFYRNRAAAKLEKCVTASAP